MTEQPTGHKGPTLQLPIPVESPSGGGPGKDKPQSHTEMYNTVMETLTRNLEMEGAARASRVYSTSPDGDHSGRPEGSGQAAVRPFQDLKDAALLFGIDFNLLIAGKDALVTALREDMEAKTREVYELRLKDLTQVEDRIRNVAKEAADRRAGGGDLGTAMGLGELDPEVRKQLQERAFGLARPPSGDGVQPKQAAAPFSVQWFKEWEDMGPGVMAVARMFGMVPKEEAENGKPVGTMVTMEDVRSGKLPIELAVSLRTVEVNRDLEVMRIDKEDARENRRMDLLGEINQNIKTNLPDLLGAIRDVASEHENAAETEGARKTDRGETQGQMGIKCGDCGYVFKGEQELESYICPRCGERLDPTLKPTTAEEPVTNVSYVVHGENGPRLSV